MNKEHSNQRSFEQHPESEVEISDVVFTPEEAAEEILENPEIPVTTAYRRANQWGGVVVALLGLGLVWGGFDLGLMRGQALGPGMFPVLMGSLLIGLGLLLVLTATWGRMERSGDTLLPDSQGAKRLLWTAVLTIVLLWVFPWFGYQLSMTVYIFGMLVLVGARKIINSLIIALVFSVGSYWLFTAALGLYLPLSSIFFLRAIGI